ncbi:hypothetical protein G3R49_05015 [Shewanella sp. WXL01]|uniref:Uncharacterized protein n=1 Tax=Shewanella maritima TaxID=2520507 RepID=A0A411PF31_9GAMM|nr:MULTISPECIES: hypothetical protein [Shewanella]NKF49931.1 hypothetical protein [Shewanella sp. WXL01]QBF82012.1 hypothetical protein EXU30_04325 [Shewanella maritima]
MKQVSRHTSKSKQLLGFIALAVLALAISYRLEQGIDWLLVSFQIIDATGQFTTSMQMPAVPDTPIISISGEALRINAAELMRLILDWLF